MQKLKTNPYCLMSGNSFPTGTQTMTFLWLVQGLGVSCPHHPPTPALTSPFSQGPSSKRQLLWRQLGNAGQGYPLVCSKRSTAHCAQSICDLNG